MQYKLSKYETTVPLLSFLRGWIIALAIFMGYTCLVNFSHGYSAPVSEVLVLGALVLLLSWKEIVTVNDGEISTIYQHQLIPHLKSSEKVVPYCKSMTLEIKPASFGYVDWVVVGLQETVTLLSTGKLS